MAPHKLGNVRKPTEDLNTANIFPIGGQLPVV